MNVGQTNLFKYSETVNRLRAAIANEAPDEVRSELFSSIRKDGLDVEGDERRGSITLVRGNLEEIQAKVEKLIADRSAARARKDWAESDRIRNELLAMGIELEDRKDGTTTWKVKR